MDSASTRRGPRFTVPRVALPAFLIATRCQLDTPPSRWEQTKASPSNRNKTRLLISRLLGSAAPALSVRLRASQVHLEASAMRVLDCGFRRVIAYPPGGRRRDVDPNAAREFATRSTPPRNACLDDRVSPAQRIPFP